MVLLCLPFYCMSQTWPSFHQLLGKSQMGVFLVSGQSHIKINRHNSRTSSDIGLPQVVWIKVCLSVCYICFFLDNCCQGVFWFCIWLCYGALWVGWSDSRRPFSGQNSKLANLILYHSMQITWPRKFWFSSYDLKNSWPVRLLDYFFRLQQRMTKEFSNFYMILKMILYHHKNCMSRKILVLELWPIKLLANQIAW